MLEKRREIIEVAALLMQSKGYENTNLSDILEAGKIGKGQFYYYFKCKRELGLAVIDYFIALSRKELLENILNSKKDPKVKLDEMFQWVIENQWLKHAKCGCFFGNIAVEMSEHDENFRIKIKEFFELWIEKLKLVLEEMIKSQALVNSIEIDKLAQGIVAMLEGGILIMKNKQDINVLKDTVILAKYLINTFVV